MNQDNNSQETTTSSDERVMKGKHKFFVRIFLCVALIVLGILVRLGLGALREPPRPADIPPPQLKVEVEAVCPGSAPITIHGYGEVKALDSLVLTPKVAGEVVHVHPDLEVGNVIPEGDLLYRIDQRDYLAGKRQAKAQVDRLGVTINLLKRQYEQSRTRLRPVERARDIALEEFERDVRLFEEQDIGSQSMVNLSEINYRQAQDTFEQLEQAIDLFPLRIQEAEIGLEAAEAALEMALLSFERTEEYAPFDARIQHKQIEVGQPVAPGAVVLMLANDSVLELSVPIDSRDARRWLPFSTPDDSPSPNWFRTVEPVECTVTWTEDPQNYEWQGTLHRVVRFDPMTRTVTVAVRIDNDAKVNRENGLPLVEGMFCSVTIPGRTLHDVYRLPRWTVSFDGYAYIADGDRLRRRAVNVVRTQGEETYVDEGLSPGDIVVMTRLVDPLPGILLEYEMPETTDCGPGTE